MSRVAEYLRRSMPGEESKNYSMAVQHDDIATWAEREGHEIVQSYSDPGAKSYTLARPIFQQLLADARAGKFDIVAVGRYDRFSRIQEQAAVATYQLKQCGVRVISVTQPVPDGAVGTMMTNMYHFASELELENIRARLWTGKRKRVRSGMLPPLPYPKYGYQFAGEKKERYVPHPVNADLVRRIFAMYAAGETLRSIAQTFSREGIPTPSQSVIADGYSYAGRVVGTYWHPITVRKILMDTAYVGRMVGFKTQYIETTRKLPITGEVVPVVRQVVRDEDDPERVPYSNEVCPALVTEEVFGIAQQLLKTNQAAAAKHLKHPDEALLRHGLAKCGYCGRFLTTGWSSEQNTNRYRCSMKWREAHTCSAPTKFSITSRTLDDACWEWFVRQLSHPERMQQIYQEFAEHKSSEQEAESSQLEATKTAIAEAKKEENSYLDSLGRAAEDYRDVLIGRAQEARQRWQALEKDLGVLEEMVGNREAQAALLKSFADSSAEALRRLENATFAEKRLALRVYDVQAILYDGSHKPRYRFTWLGGIDPEPTGPDSDKRSTNSDDCDSPQLWDVTQIQKVIRFFRAA